MNIKLLRLAMVKNDDYTLKDLADYLGINRGTIYKKMKRKKGCPFKAHEIQKIKERYNLTAEEVDKIFFRDVEE